MSGVIESRLRRCSHCAAKLVDQRSRARVGQHPPHLPLEHRRLVQLAARRHVEQLVVRDAAPEEERQPRRQLEIADAIRRVRRDAGRILLDAEQELRAHQHGGQRHLDAASKSSVRARLPIELERPVQVGVGHRPPVGPPHQRARICLAARVFVAGLVGTRHEDPAPAGRVARALRAHTDR